MPDSDGSMVGRTCLITGASAGVGEAAAWDLARRGARVVIVGRNPARCAASVASIRAGTGNPEVEFLTADLSSQSEVRRLAREFLARHDRLHVLINNAGALFALRRESVDGIEMTLALNHLAGFLLTELLLDVLKASAPARVVIVSSGAHRDAKAFDFGDPQARARRGIRSYAQSEAASLLCCLTMPWAHPGFRQYAMTKLANLLFTLEFAERLRGSGVTANALHPGFVASRFGSGNGALGLFMRFWSKLLGVSPRRGARTVLYLACAPEMEGLTGQYFEAGKAVVPSAAARDTVAAGRLWALSEQWTRIPPSQL